MGSMNNGAGTLVPSKGYKNGTEVPPPENMRKGAGVLTPLSIYRNGTKVPAPKYLNNYNENELKKIGNSDFLIRLTKAQEEYLYSKERIKNELTKVEKDFIEQIEHSVKKLKGKI